MAKYFTTDQEYYCDNCDRYCTEEHMVWGETINSDTPGGYCPGCKETLWAKFVTIGQLDPTTPAVVLAVVEQEREVHYLRRMTEPRETL